MDYLYIKALHIIFVICWFAALFYMVRLFIYAAEAQQKEEPARKILTDQLLLMQKKLWYIIGWPGLIGTFIFGWWMILDIPALLSQPWMVLKLIVVGLLCLYHLRCEMIFKQQKKGIFKDSSLRLRLFNELATVFLVAIVFLVVVKSQGSLVWGILGTIFFGALLMLFVTLYKSMKKKEESQVEEKKELRK